VRCTWSPKRYSAIHIEVLAGEYPPHSYYERKIRI
jgi:hypothetical protein